MHIGIEVTRASYDLPRGCDRPPPKIGRAFAEPHRQDLNRMVSRAKKFDRTSDEQKFAVLQFLELRNVEFTENQDRGLRVWDSAQYDPGPEYTRYQPLQTGIYEVGVVDSENQLVQGQIPTQVMYILQPGSRTFRFVEVSRCRVNPVNLVPLDDYATIMSEYAESM